MMEWVNVGLAVVIFTGIVFAIAIGLSTLLDFLTDRGWI